MTSTSGVLNAAANAGTATQYSVTVTNTGTAPLTEHRPDGVAAEQVDGHLHAGRPSPRSLRGSP